MLTSRAPLVQALRAAHRARAFATAKAARAPPAKRIVTVEITKTDENGDGIGRDDASGVHINVPFAIPGDVYDVEVYERDLTWKPSRSREFLVLGVPVRQVRTSPATVAPKCTAYFEHCGGCRHQHVAYQAQLEHKQARINELLAPLQAERSVEIRPILGVPQTDAQAEDRAIYGYRNKMEFSCSTGRWLLQDDKPRGDADEQATAPLPDWTLGLFPMASTHVRRTRQLGSKRQKQWLWNARLLSIDACSLQDDECNAILGHLQTLGPQFNIPAYDFQKNRGFLKNVVLRKGWDCVNKRKELMVAFVTSNMCGPDSDALAALTAELVQQLDATAGEAGHNVVSIVQRADAQAMRHEGIKPDDAPVERVLYGRDHYVDSILGHRFHISFDSFFQPNTAQAEVLYRVVQQALQDDHELADKLGRPPVVWDLFCGVGSIGICMKPFASKVLGIEIVDAAVSKARANARFNGYTEDEMAFFGMDLTKKWDNACVTDAAVSKPDVVIVDPPRAGLHKKLVDLLLDMVPPRICYVSCNPQTQARDLALVCAAGAYEVAFLQPVDMLPHTPHIETVAWLTRPTRSS